MATSSADPDALDAFASTSRDLNEVLASSVTALVSAYQAFLAQPNDVRVGAPSQMGTSPPRLEHFGDTIDMAGTHRSDRVAEANWVQVVARAFREAGSGGSIRTLNDGVIDQRLAAAGAPTGPPRLITVETPSAAGLTVSSGFKDDPVNCGTGSFIEPEVDLPAPRRLWAMAWVRNHNSRFPDPGPLGRGWSSWASTRLEVTATGARFQGPDGQVVELARTEDGFGTDPNLAARAVESGQGAELVWHSGERWRFRPDGRPKEVVLGPAGKVTFQHDRKGRLRAMVHDAGRRLDVKWNGERIVSVKAVDAGGGEYGTVTYSYVDGDLVASDAPGGRRSYEVDDQGRVVAVTDADGVELARNTYDPDGRVLEQRSPRGLCTTYGYRPGPVTTVRDGEDGPKVVMFHDLAGRLTGAVDDHGARLTRRFGDQGNPVAVRDRTGAVTVQEFDERGRLVRRSLPGGGEERLAYDGKGRLVARTGPDGAATALAYDGEDDVVPTRITDPDGGTTVVEADSDLVRKITDADGVTLGFEHDAEGFPIAVVDGLGNRRTLTRDHGGRITGVRLPGGQEQRFEYDAAGRLTRRIDPDGAVWELAWSPGGRLIGYVTPDGSHFAWERDEAGDVASFVDPLGAVTTLRTDVLGNVVQIVAADGAKFELTYDGLCRLTAVHDPAGGATFYEHDANGRTVAVADALGHTRRLAYDAAGNVVRAVDAEGREMALAYDGAGRLAQRVLPGGASEVVERDRCGRPVAATDATGRTTHYEYTPAGRLRRAVTPLGHAFEWQYDAAGRVVGRTDPTGASTRYHLDANGWVTRIHHPDGEATRLLRDPCGRVVERHHPDGGVTRLGYDALGRVVEVTDAAGGRRRRRYDGRGVLVEATDAAGGVTKYGYDERGLLASVTDAGGGTVGYERDPMGRITASTDPLGRVTRLEYDPAGRPRRLLQPDGRPCELRFDRASALVGLAADGQEAIIERDPLGRVARLVDPTGEHRFERDPAGRLLARHGPAGTLRWRYDADGRPISLVYPDGTEAVSEYDAAGRLVALAHPVAGRGELERDVAGRVLALRAPGVGRSFTWRHCRLVAYRDGDHAVELERDVAGRVVEVRDAGGTARYDYDDAGRLVSAGDRTWAYDDAGNLVAENGARGPVRYTYDAAHQLVAVDRNGSRTELSYDAAGRRLAESGGRRQRRYRWGPFGRLAGVDDTELAVNALGELVAVDGEALAWDPVGAVPQLRQVGERSIVGAGEPWAIVSDGAARWLNRDWDGSPRGTVTDPWGRPADPGPGLEPGFRGEWAVHGLVWLRQRAYDPATRSFLSPDPLPGVAGSTTVANPYHYGHHNPLGHVDPLGLQPLTDAEWEAWKAAHPTLAEQVTAPVRAAADFVGDHWEVISAGAVIAAGVVMVATGVGAVAGAGILIGAGSNLAGQMISGGPIDARNVALAGVVGGVAGGVGGATFNSVRAFEPVARSAYTAVITNVAAGGASGLTSGVVNETVAERLDRDPFNDTLSADDVIIETTGGVMFGGIGSMVPHADDVLGLGLPQATLERAQQVTDVSHGLWSESALQLHGD